MYILSADRGKEGYFERYQEYLKANRSAFDADLFHLVTSTWWYRLDGNGLHDTWLEKLELTEPSQGSRQETRSVSLKVYLLDARHEGKIELSYPNVFHYRFEGGRVASGHRDWRYDQFTVSESGRILHEIEWAGYEESARWVN